MRIFKTRWFNRFAEKEDIDNHALKDAILRAEKGLADAELGSNLLKIRIARKGQGRSSGYRTLVAFKKGKIAVSLFGFAKRDKDNIENNELASLKEISNGWVKADNTLINLALSQGLLKEVHDE